MLGLFNWKMLFSLGKYIFNYSITSFYVNDWINIQHKQFLLDILFNQWYQHWMFQLSLMNNQIHSKVMIGVLYLCCINSSTIKCWMNTETNSFSFLSNGPAQLGRILFLFKHDKNLIFQYHSFVLVHEIQPIFLLSFSIKITIYLYFQ